MKNTKKKPAKKPAKKLSADVRLAAAREYVTATTELLGKLAPYCPAAWAAKYANLADAAQHFAGALCDGGISGAELQAALEGVRIAAGKLVK